MAKKSSKKKKTKSKARRDHGASINKWKQGTKQSGGEFIRPDEKVTYYKLIEDDYEHAWIHWMEDQDGNNKRMICRGDPNGSKANRETECPLCRAIADGVEGISTNHRYYFNVLKGKAKKIKGKTIIVFNPEVAILELGPQAGVPICSFGAEIKEDVDGEWGDKNINSVTDIVIKILKEGSGLNTKYTVRHLTRYKINGDVDVTSAAELSSIVKPASEKEMLLALGATSNEDEEEEDWDDEEYDEDDAGEEEDWEDEDDDEDWDE